MLTRRRTRALPAAAALTRPQNGNTPLEVCEDRSDDNAAKRAAKDATRDLLRNSFKFAYFLSHFQRNGGGAMLSLKGMLEARGMACWLDKDATPNE